MSTNDAEPNNENADELPNETAEPHAAGAPEEAEGGLDDGDESELSATQNATDAVAAGEGGSAVAQPRTKAKAAMTPGERLAAQKAAKAAKKIAMRGRDAELVQEKAIDVAEESTRKARSWVETHAKQLAAGALALAVLVGGVGALRWFLSRDDSKAGALLWKATEATEADVRTSGESAPATDGELSFASAEAKNREALSRYDRVISTYPKSEAALFARLGRAATLLASEKPAEARAEYERVATAETDRSLVRAQALEGVGTTYFEERNYAKAKEQFDELRGIDHERFRDLADFHLARVLHAQGQVEPAKQKLRALLEHLGEEGAEPHAYVQQQAELFLQQLDPSSAPRRGQGGAPGGLDLDSMPPELLQQLIRQMQQEQGGGQ